MKHRLPFVFLFLALQVSLPAAEPPWKIGLAAVKITPEEPVLMYGYGGRNDPHQGVASDLFAKALALEDAAGHRAVLVTCDLGGLHGDMIERIAARLKQHHGLPRASVLYNASHTHAGPWAWVAAEVARVLAEKLAPVRPPLRTAFQTVALPIAPPAAREKLEAMAKSSGWPRYVGARQLALLARGEPPATTYPMPVALWHFGADLALVGLSGEPVNDYVHLIEDAVGPTRLWVAGYCHDVFGYVPTARILREGGYESRGIDRGDAVGQFTPAAQDVIVAALTAMARATGRLK